MQVLLVTAQALILVGLLIAAAGLIHERRAGRWRIPKPTFVMLLAALSLGVLGALLFMISAAVG
jgi:hypothetical protein